MVVRVVIWPLNVNIYSHCFFYPYRRWCWASMKKKKDFQSLFSPNSPLSSRLTFTPRSQTQVWPKAWWDVSCLPSRPTVSDNSLAVMCHNAYCSKTSEFKTISFPLSGSLGAFCKVHQTDKRMLDFYSKLGCFEVAKMEGFPKDFIIMGRSLWRRFVPQSQAPVVYCLDMKDIYKDFCTPLLIGPCLGPFDTFMHRDTDITHRCAALTLILAHLELRPTRKGCSAVWISRVSIV